MSYRDGITQYPIWQDANGVMDASLTYDVNDNLSLVIQATNILDTESNLTFVLDNQGTRAGKSWFIAEQMAVVGARFRF